MGSTELTALLGQGEGKLTSTQSEGVLTGSVLQSY